MHICANTAAETLLLVKSDTSAKMWLIKKQIIHSFIQTAQLN